MFGWFWNLFSSKPAEGFLPCEQEFFPYWDGRRMRKGDPLSIMFRLSADEGLNLEMDLKIASLPDPGAAQAFSNVCKAVRQAFDVKPFDEGGLLDINCKELLLTFLRWNEKKNPLPPSSPTYFPPTQDALADRSPETSSMDSGLTDSEPSTGKAPLSSLPSA